MLSSTFRFLSLLDFQAQISQGLLIEILTVTLPFIAIVVTYGTESGSMVLYGLIGILLHLVNLLMALKHIHASQFDDSRRCVLVDPRTCQRLRDAFAWCSCCNGDEPSDFVTTVSPKAFSRDGALASQSHLQKIISMQRDTTSLLRTPETSQRAAREIPMLPLQASRNQSDGVVSGAFDVRLNQDSAEQLPTLNSGRADTNTVDVLPSLPMKAEEILASLDWEFAD